MTTKEAKEKGYIQCQHCKKHKPRDEYQWMSSVTAICTCGCVFDINWKEVERAQYKEFMRHGK